MIDDRRAALVERLEDAAGYASKEHAAIMREAAADRDLICAEVDRLRAALKELRELADKERWNTAQLLSYPPQSSAAWNIRNAIDVVLGGEND